jgi:hypothetical protein
VNVEVRHADQICWALRFQKDGAVAFELWRSDVDAETFCGSFDQRRCFVAEQFFAERITIPKAEKFSSDAIDENGIRAADRNVVGRGKLSSEAIAAHSRSAFCEHDIGRGDFEHVGHALGKNFKRLHVFCARVRVVIFRHRERA